MPISRRTALKGLGASGAIPLLGATTEAGADTRFRVAGQPVEVAVTMIEGIIRISVIPLEDGRPRPIPHDGSLVQEEWHAPIIHLTDQGEALSNTPGTQWKKLTVASDPLTIRIEEADGALIQQIRVDGETGAFTFLLGDGPVLGFGEGGPQFDRRAPPIGCGAGRGDTGCGRTAAGCPSPG